MKHLFDSLAPADLTLAMASEAPVLVTAFTPTTVEMLARAIHMGGGRRERPFVVVTCGSDGAASALLELQAASVDAGTVCCVEVERADAATQAVIGRLIEGARVRVIAGTTESLYARVQTRQFSETLFYRLNVIHMRVDSVDRAGAQAS